MQANRIGPEALFLYVCMYVCLYVCICETICCDTDDNIMWIEMY